MKEILLNMAVGICWIGPNIGINKWGTILCPYHPGVSLLGLTLQWNLTRGVDLKHLQSRLLFMDPRPPPWTCQMSTKTLHSTQLRNLIQKFFRIHSIPLQSNTHVAWYLFRMIELLVWRISENSSWMTKLALINNASNYLLTKRNVNIYLFCIVSCYYTSIVAKIANKHNFHGEFYGFIIR